MEGVVGEREELTRGWGGATAGSGRGQCGKWAGLWLNGRLILGVGGVMSGSGRGLYWKRAGL